MGNLDAQRDRHDGAGTDFVRALAQDLRASEARFRNVIEANADGVIVVRQDGVIAYANPAATSLLGRRAEVLVGCVFGIPITAGGTTEIDVHHASGEPRVAELRVAPTEWEGLPALLASLRDVTEHKRLESALREHAEQLALADRRKDQFLAMLAHELRNPLAPILSAAHLMRLRDDDPALLARMRDIVEHQASHIARLVDDLLDVSRFNQGKVQLSKQAINFTAVVTQAVETARPLVEAGGRTLTCHMSREPIWLDADRTRMTQVLGNLIDNATKFTECGGEIIVSASRDGDVAVVSVRDNGIGIAPEMLPRVFELFAQADSSLDRSRGGLGIGLTLVQTLVTLHGGSITASSAGRGTGAEFVIRLPGAMREPPKSAAAQSSRDPNPARSRRVLIVDDNRFAADGLANLLQLCGHQARVAYAGPAAIEIAREYRPELVLLDIGLPEMDGFEVAKRLRVIDGLSEITLVAVTGYGHQEILERSSEAGLNHHLVKPVDFDALLAILNNAPSP
jgi:signal transduction histidine kinase